MIYKIISIKNLIKSIKWNYLFFNRVDNYKDFPHTNLHDGEQLLKDVKGNRNLKFEKNLNFSASDYYNEMRKKHIPVVFR